MSNSSSPPETKTQKLRTAASFLSNCFNHLLSSLNSSEHNILQSELPGKNTNSYLEPRGQVVAGSS